MPAKNMLRNVYTPECYTHCFIYGVISLKMCCSENGASVKTVNFSQNVSISREI